MNGKGFIKLPRSLLNEWRDILTTEEVGILIYLTAMANYEEKPRRAPKGDQLQRGQLVISVRWFAERFNISKSKAERLLAKWENLGIIKRRTVFGTPSGTPTGTLITLEFYAFSQSAPDSNRDRKQDKTGDAIKKNRNYKKPSPLPATNGRPGEAKQERNEDPPGDPSGQRKWPGIIFTR